MAVYLGDTEVACVRSALVMLAPVVGVDDVLCAGEGRGGGEEGCCGAHRVLDGLV